MYAILYFDTEDSISPPKAGCDDIVLWIARTLSDCGLRGSFHIIGDKARILESRGRRDVIEAVARHDVSSHFDHGSVHPMTVEEVAASDWAGGVALTLERERPGFYDIERIFGRCSALTRHGSSYAPQIARATGLTGRIFHGVPFALPSHRLFWFCGTLCTSQLGLIRVRADKPSVGRFGEDTFADDERFTKQLAAFAPRLAEVAAEWDFAALFGCHPLRLVLTQFCDNYQAGRNVSPPIPPPVRPVEQQNQIKRNFERYVRTIAATPGVQMVGLGDLQAIYGRRPMHIDMATLQHYAAAVRNDPAVPLHDWFSPAELLTAMAEAMQRRDSVGHWPEVVRRPAVIGPTADVAATTPDELSADAVNGIARTICDHAAATGELPARIACGSGAIGPAEALGVLAQHVAASQVPAATCAVTPRRPWPVLGDEVEQDVLGLSRWRIFDPTISFARIARYTQLQCWSLAPAHATGSRPMA